MGRWCLYSAGYTGGHNRADESPWVLDVARMSATAALEQPRSEHTITAMCMFRITTYDECWAQYTHVLICSSESYNNNQLNSPGDRVASALKCPILKSEHIHNRRSICVCKTHPTQNSDTICERKWGGDFVGDVNCTMLPGSAVRFEFRGREWKNCTNVEKLLRDGQRYVPDSSLSAIKSRVWDDSEWDGDSKLVDWKDTDWVTLAGEGKSMWQKQQQQRKAIGAQHTVAEQSQTYDIVQQVKREKFPGQHNPTRPKGQMPLPLYHPTAARYVDKNYDAIVDWGQSKDHREATANAQYRPDSLSIRQPLHQRQSSLTNINEAQHRTQFTAFTEHKSQEKIPLPSTVAAQTQPAVPSGPNMIPVWELARLLREKEEKDGKKFGDPSSKTWMDLVSDTTTRMRDDEHSMYYVNQAMNVQTQVPAPREVSSAPIYASENSQDRRKMELEEKRNNFLQNTYKQRFAIRKKLNDQTQEAGQPVQYGTQGVNMHISEQQDNAPLTNTPSHALWNGLSEFVIPHEYNNALPESDDKNFNFNNYSPTKHLTEDVEMRVPHRSSNFAPKDLLGVPPQASYSVVEDSLEATHSTVGAVSRDPVLTSRMLRHVERLQARRLDPESDPYQNASETKLRAERRAMRIFREVRARSRIQAIKQEDPTQNALQIQSQPDNFVQQSSHLQEIPEIKAMRKLQEIEDQSKIQGNRNKRDVLHDQGQLDAFLQDFTRSQQEIAREMWMAEKEKVDMNYTNLDYQATGDVNESDGEAEIEAQKKRKIDLHYSGLLLEMDAKRRKLGEDKVDFESEEARNKRMRDLQYSGLIPNMDAAKPSEDRLQVESDEDLKKRQRDLESSRLKNANAQSILPKKKEKKDTVSATTKQTMTPLGPVEIPASFHESYQKQFPKKPKEPKAQFRHRKVAAFLNSVEYKQLKSAGAGTIAGKVTDMQRQGGKGNKVSDYDSGMHPTRSKSNDEELIRYTIDMPLSMMNIKGGKKIHDYDSGMHPTQSKRHDEELIRHATDIPLSMVNSKGGKHSQNQNEANSGRQRRVRKSRKAKALVVQEQPMSNTGGNGELEPAGKLIVKILDVKKPRKVMTVDDEESAEYESDQDMDMKIDTRGSQITDFIGPQRPLQSFHITMPVAIQYTDTVLEEKANGSETVVDLTTGTGWEFPVDLTSD
ncbi:hypothetical protein NHQ30_008769 [Ciborinia camelliae]|nr:hypothetical protein NHQ30_008769 [Ciborinia camelliae]